MHGFPKLPYGCSSDTRSNERPSSPSLSSPSTEGDGNGAAAAEEGDIYPSLVRGRRRHEHRAEEEEEGDKNGGGGGNDNDNNGGGSTTEEDTETSLPPPPRPTTTSGNKQHHHHEDDDDDENDDAPLLGRRSSGRTKTVTFSDPEGYKNEEDDDDDDDDDGDSGPSTNMRRKLLDSGMDSEMVSFLLDLKAATDRLKLKEGVNERSDDEGGEATADNIQQPESSRRGPRSCMGAADEEDDDDSSGNNNDDNDSETNCDREEPPREESGRISKAAWSIFSRSVRELNTEMLPEDSFSFVVTSSPFSIPFWSALSVFMIQISTFSLLLVSVVYSRQIPIPANVDPTVRGTQLVAVIITVLTQGGSDCLESTPEQRKEEDDDDGDNGEDDDVVSFLKYLAEED